MKDNSINERQIWRIVHFCDPLALGCNNAPTKTLTPSPGEITPTATDIPTQTPTLISNSQTESIIHQPKLISKWNLKCSSLDKFTQCVDDVLNIEFTYPANWGEIEGVLRTGGYSGYAYDYYFDGKSISETEPLVGRWKKQRFFQKVGVACPRILPGMEIKACNYKKSCDPILKDLFPYCQKVSSNVTWMIRIPNSQYICESAPGFYTTPVFRIEIDLPENRMINGFVFEAPFFSEKFSNEIENELYPLLGLDLDRSSNNL